MKRTAFLAAAMTAALMTGVPAFAEETSAMPTPVAGVDDHAPLEGANSFTQDQVAGRLTDNGFTEIAGLTLDDKGIWRGTAKYQNQTVDVAVDYRGNIVYGGKIMAKQE